MTHVYLKIKLVGIQRMEQGNERCQISLATGRKIETKKKKEMDKIREMVDD